MRGDGTPGVGARCAQVAAEADALAARVAGLPPPTWTGPAADELGARVRHAVHLLDDGAEALHRAGGTAREAGRSGEEGRGWA